MKSWLTFCALIFALLISNPLRARIIHVPGDSSTIQGGINGAVDGDTVLVARGHYYERINFLGKSILVGSNFIFDHDTTTIDSTIIDADTSVLGGSNAGSVVVFHPQQDTNSAIMGFTIQNGVVGSGGGGIYCGNYSVPTIDHNVIANNRAQFGGGIYCSLESSPAIDSNTIIGNVADFGGGGICCHSQSLAILTGNVISDNSASYGGGIYCYSLASPVIRGNTIGRNHASTFGGAIFCDADCESIIHGNLIDGNTCDFLGGGVLCFAFASPTLWNNSLNGNSSAISGGGIYCLSSSSPIIKDNIISNSRHGGGIVCEQGTNPDIRYNDVWNNADEDFDGCPAGVGDTTWGNNFNGTPCDSFYNIIRDPLFADTIDFKLLCNSPCIDAGDTGIYVPPDSGGCRIDMGTHEYPYILGDANSDGAITPKRARIGAVTVGDIVFMINYLFQSGPEPCPYHAADTNCDGEVNIADIVCLINYLFRGGDLPC